MSERKSAAAKVQDKVKQVAQEDFNNASTLANDAVRSGAYLYPFKVSQSMDAQLQWTRFDAYRVSCTSSRTARYGVLSPRS
jgi:hypothetical protein